MFRIALVSIFIFLCGSHPASAQENALQKKEQELIRIYRKLSGFSHGDSDSLVYYSNLFSSELHTVVARYAGTLEYSFKELINEHACYVKTSKDGLFRIYSWDSQLGGTMHFFNVLYQYKTGTSTKTQLLQTKEGDPAWYCSDIFSLKTKKTSYYLAVINGIYSSKDIAQSIKAFQISGFALNDSIPLMKTDSGLENSLSVYYDFFSVVDRPERPVAVIKYDSKKRIISISKTDENEQIVPGYKQFIFNGRYFEQQVANTKKKRRNTQ